MYSLILFDFICEIKFLSFQDCLFLQKSLVNNIRKNSIYFEIFSFSKFIEIILQSLKLRNKISSFLLLLNFMILAKLSKRFQFGNFILCCPEFFISLVQNSFNIFRSLNIFLHLITRVSNLHKLIQNLLFINNLSINLSCLQLYFIYFALKILVFHICLQIFSQLTIYYLLMLTLCKS